MIMNTMVGPMLSYYRGQPLGKKKTKQKKDKKNICIANPQYFGSLCLFVFPLVVNL